MLPVALLACIPGGLPRGVGPAASKLYLQNLQAGGVFQCLTGEGTISQEALNDNWCDCADGSDEPATAACAGRRAAVFHCPNSWPGESDRKRTWRLAKDLPTQFIGDGICDCCDGTDEPAGKCVDTCQAEAARMIDLKRKDDSEREDALAKRAEMARLGSAEMKAQKSRLEKDEQELSVLRQTLGAAAADDPAAQKKEKRVGKVRRLLSFDYGDDSRYLMLQFQCYNISRGKFIYRVCPFRRVEQIEGGAVTSCGTFTGWEKGDYGAWSASGSGELLTQLYDNGTSCADNPRRARVRMVCGVDSRLRDATEPFDCQYSLTLQTPAACEDYT